MQSYVGSSGEATIKNSAVEVVKAISSGNFTKAADLWGQTEDLISNVSSRYKYNPSRHFVYRNRNINFSADRRSVLLQCPVPNKGEAKVSCHPVKL